MRDKVVRKISKESVTGIYLITNKVNGKVYVGQSLDIERRWNAHRYGKGSLILKNAFNKYGLHNFDFTIVEEIDRGSESGEVIRKILIELEQKWLDDKKPFLKENGYNIQATAKPNIPIKRPEGYGKLISKIKIENNHCGKSVTQYNLIGKIIKIWKSAAEVKREIGFNAENISACCLKKQNSSYGFIWRFTEEKLTDECIEVANKSLRLSKVRQYNKKGELIAIFENTKDASIQTKINVNTIRDACNGTTKTAANYIWKFKNETLDLGDHLKRRELPINQFNLDGTLVKKWCNIKEIYEYFGSRNNTTKSVYACCDKKILKYKNFLWCWT